MITFRFSGRTPSPSQAQIGMETDQGSETLRFLLPQVADGQSAQLMMILPDGTPEALQILDGMAVVPASVTETPGRSRCWVEILGGDGIAWNSELLYLEVGDLPPISEEMERAYPTAIQDAMAAAAQAVAAANAAAESAALAETIGGTLTFSIDENNHLIVTRTIPGHDPIISDLGDVTAGCVKEAELEEALGEVDTALAGKASTEDLGKVVDGTTAVAKVNNAAATVDGEGIHLKAGGAFTHAAGNFEIDENGHVTIQNADVSGDFTSGGQPLLSKADIVVSSSEPEDPHEGMVWIKPVSSIMLGYSAPITQQAQFTNLTKSLACTGTPTEAPGAAYHYRITIPYKHDTSSLMIRRGLMVTLSNDSGSVVISGDLEDGGTSPGVYEHTFVGETDSLVWLGDESPISCLMNTTGADSTYHWIRLGNIELTCSAVYSGESSGWGAAEVKIYQ